LVELLPDSLSFGREIEIRIVNFGWLEDEHVDDADDGGGVGVDAAAPEDDDFCFANNTSSSYVLDRPGTSRFSLAGCALQANARMQNCTGNPGTTHAHILSLSSTLGSVFFRSALDSFFGLGSFNFVGATTTAASFSGGTSSCLPRISTTA
jgi:hypothetical protein